MVHISESGVSNICVAKISISPSLKPDPPSRVGGGVWFETCDSPYL